MPVPRLNRPLWLAEAGLAFSSLEGELEVDVAVVGAGITGVTAAHLLKQAGGKVALVETNAIGYGATGYTTAKLTVGHSLVYTDLIEAYGEDAARLYARSNQEAIEQVAALVAAHGIDCDLERASNFVYTDSDERIGDIRREVHAARSAGVAAELTSETDLPYPVAAAIRVDGQAQFHPWKYVSALARLVDGDGSRVLERTRATHVRSGDRCVVETRTGSIRARHVIVATQLPFLDRGLYFAKAHPMKSYAVAAAIDASRGPRGMYINVDQPTRSVRSTPGRHPGSRLLIVGGEGHKPGDDRDTHARYQRLEGFMRERFGIDSVEFAWSTHDYTPIDKLPYIGRLRRRDERVLVATGFAKWGMTKGTLAASMLVDAILGQENPYAELYDANRIDAGHSASTFVKENAKVAGFFFRDRLRRRERRDVDRLGPGEGTIVRARTKQYAVSRDDSGALHVLSARCTHLGCIVGWNPADRAWECPCHGSRFAADGTLIQGPATEDLPPRQLPESA